MEERTYIYGYDPSGRGKIDQYLISYIKSFFATGTFSHLTKTLLQVDGLFQSRKMTRNKHTSHYTGPSVERI